MKKSLVFVSLLSFIAANGAFASCKQANLQSADGTQISIDYPSNNQTDGDTAWVNPVIHVRLSNGKCNATAIGIVLVQSQFGFSGSTPIGLVNSSEDQCLFSGNAGSVTIANHGGALGQQIALEVFYPNGGTEWLVDPVSRKHNFTYSFQTEGYSPNVESCQ